MKKNLIIIFSIIFFIGVIWYVKIYKASNINMIIGEEKIKCITSSNSLSGKKDIFKFAFEQNNSSCIKYIKTGTKAIVDFGNNTPDKIYIKDILLNSNGGYMYEEHVDKTTVEVPFAKENSKYTFIIEKNMASQLSSSYVENKTDFRGYIITAHWGKLQREYAFVIKANAY